VVIIEGPDGTGKTSLAERIADRYNLEYRRPSVLSSTLGPADASIETWWRQQLRNDDGAGVYDRCFWISEPIFQLAIPHRPLLVEGAKFAIGLQDLLLARPLIIFCLPEWEKTRPIVMSGREKLEGVDERELEKVHWAYWNSYAHFYNNEPNLTLLWDFHRASDKEKQLMVAVGNYLRREYGSE
jgi:hypothetical protein